MEPFSGNPIASLTDLLGSVKYHRLNDPVIQLFGFHLSKNALMLS
jgi:hypothetical protein